ncbi:hypothetical protein BGZ70_006682 [Mortierella alpina]|uniref:M-phase phosphoprotein 6 n=1 Tax=Mortierella alpina TaxID=64518 RepID=A0A9P6M2W6_MORAP|nr:hypothetical protein BGZ70_006682 [Mortierella alpina]
MAEVPHKKALSGKLLTMKFMQREQEQETRQKLEKEQSRVVTEAHWVLDQKAVDLPKPKFKVEYEPSFLQMNATERTSVGRVSFQKFNTEIETTASKSASAQQLDRELKRERASEIGEEELADGLGHSNGAKRSKTASASKKPTTNRRAPPQKSNNSGPSNDDKSNGSTSSTQNRSFMKPQE